MSVRRQADHEQKGTLMERAAPMWTAFSWGKASSSSIRSTADYFLGQWYGDVLLQPGQGFWYRSGGDQDMTVVKPYE